MQLSHDNVKKLLQGKGKVFILTKAARNEYVPDCIPVIVSPFAL